MLFSRSAGKSKRFFTIFGKVPSMTDFLAVQASHPMVKDLDRLVQGVMTAMAGNHEWKQQFDAIPAVDLMWRSPAGPEVFIGVLLPSQDAAGRRYPLLGGLVLPGGEAARYGPLLLLGAELFCSRLRDLLCRAREDAAGVAELRDYLAEQASGKGMDLLEPALLGEIYNNFINEENALELGRPAGEASPATALRRTVLHLLFSRSQGLEGRDEERKYLVLPLSLEPGKSMLHASVWICRANPCSMPACGWTFWPSWRIPPPSAPGDRMPWSTRWMAPPACSCTRAVPPPWPAQACWAANVCNGITSICSRGPVRCTSTPCIPRFPPSLIDLLPVQPIRLWT